MRDRARKQTRMRTCRARQCSHFAQQLRWRGSQLQGRVAHSHVRNYAAETTTAKDPRKAENGTLAGAQPRQSVELVLPVADIRQSLPKPATTTLAYSKSAIMCIRSSSLDPLRNLPPTLSSSQRITLPVMTCSARIKTLRHPLASNCPVFRVHRWTNISTDSVWTLLNHT